MIFIFYLLFPPVSWGDEEIRIGLTISETGPFSTEIGPFRKLVNAWADDVNRNGGLAVNGNRLRVKLFIYDDRSDEATARRMYERLALVHKVHFMFGPYSSPLTFAASTAAENHKIPFLAICANSPKIYTRGYKWIACVIDEAPRYTYRYWEMLAHEKMAGSVGFIVEDTLHPKGVFEGAVLLAQRADIKVTYQDIIPPDMKDFSGNLINLVKKAPDIVFVSSNIPFAISFINQALEMHLNPMEFHVIHHGGVFRRALGKGAELITGQSYWEEGMNTGQHERFKKLLNGSGVILEDYPWAPAYMMAFEVAEAVFKNSGTTDALPLMNTMKSSKVETIGGVITFTDRGAGSINTFPSQIQDSKYEIVWPTEVATGKHIFPRPGYKKD